MDINYHMPEGGYNQAISNTKGKVIHGTWISITCLNVHIIRISAEGSGDVSERWNESLYC
jgi:hypothetical protein